MARNTNQRRQPAGQRQLRVGEEIRHALADLFLRGECHDLDIAGVSVTVSEVRLSPDLKHATAFVMPLGGKKRDEVIDVLTGFAPVLRTMVGSKLRMRYTPRIHFKLDTSFEEAGRINQLLLSPAIARDLAPESEE